MDERIEALESVISALIDILGPLHPPSTQAEMLNLWNSYVDIALALEKESE